MKKRYIPFMFLCIEIGSITSGFAQTTPTTSKNYVRTIALRESLISTYTMSTLSTKKRVETINYLDALGRPIQSVTVKGSPLGKDIVAALKYDGAGRQNIQYLPYATSNSSGVYISDPFTACTNYYNGTVAGRESGNYPYDQTMFEISPLSRVTEEKGPDVWRTHVSQAVYSTNTTAVNHWKTDKTSLSIPAGQLFATEYLDEDGHKTREYKNKLGQVIQKSVYNGSIWLNTSYVYNELGLLSIVVPPKAAGASDTELCYYYTYDKRKRMTLKDLPGAYPVYMAYDARDRLVMVQDGNLDSDDKWLATIYDALNRPVLTAYTGAGKTIVDVGTAFNNGFINATYSTSGTYFDYNVSMPTGYSISQSSIQSANYYDNYDFIAEFGTGYDFSTYNITSPSGHSTNYSSLCKGLNTGTLTRVKNNQIDNISDDLLLSVNYFDVRGRILRVVSDNHLGGKDVLYNKYNFSDQVIQTVYRHNATSSSELVKIVTDYTYDEQGRLLTEKVTVNSQPTITLASYTYNELGEVITKKLHGDASGNNFNQQLDYTYNIKGWLRKINSTASLGSDLFALELRYNAPGTSDALYSNACYNGNISEMLWNNNGTPKGYGFSYDGANRLSAADYADGSSFTSNQNNYNTSYGYDNNGNLSNLSRYLNGTLIDNLVYTYLNSGNRLSSVQDNSNNALGYDDNDGNYTYDANGNMVYDASKGVNISYNELNLPELVQFGANDNIRYIYDDSGNKRAKVVDGTNAANNTRIDYCGNIIYEDNQLKAIFTSEGRIVKDGTTYNFEYNMKDHLGNVRVAFIGQSSGTPLVTQRSSYFPFGMVAEQTNSYSGSILANKYLYNGKELQDDDIAGVKLDWYDYGARMYDPALGRWHVIDPMAEKYASISPYTYVGNNPINLIDPDGRIWEPSDAVKQSHSYRLAMNTGTGQALRTMFETGSMKNHIYRTRGANIMKGTGEASMGFMRDGKYLPINAITAKDINDDLQLVYNVSISNLSLNSIIGAKIFGHESFIHNLRKIQSASKVLATIGESSNEWIAWRLQMIGGYEGDIEKKDGNYTNGGQLDHVKFLKGQKEMFNKYIGQLLQGASGIERTELMHEINTYVDDLVKNGDENIRRYTGDDAKKMFEELQKRFK